MAEQLKQVTDPALIQQIQQAQQSQQQLTPVTDPNIISQVEHQSDQQRSQEAASRLGDTASGVVRPLVEGVTSLPSAVGDIAIGGTAMGIDLAKSALGMDPQHRTPWGVLMSPARGIGPVELPSKNVREVLDHYTTPPSSGFGSFAEFVNSVLAGGFLSPSTTAMRGAGAAGAGLNDIERMASLRQAHQVGYRVPPTEMPGNAIQKTVEGVAGSAKVTREMSHTNQEVTNRLTKIALGLHPEHPPLTGDVLDAVREEAGQVYERLGNTGPVNSDHELLEDIANAGEQFSKLDRSFPADPELAANGPLEPDFSMIERLKGRWLQSDFTAREAIDAMRYLYSQSKVNLKIYDPVKNAVGMVQRQIAEAFQARLGRHAEEIGQPQLAQALMNARIRIAQAHTVEMALNEGSGNVSARKLAQLYANGSPLTNELEQIAQTGLTFPRAVQEVDKMPKESPFSVVDFFVGAGGYLDRPSLMLAVLARPALRQALNTRAAQMLAMRNATRPPMGIAERSPGGIAAGYQGLEGDDQDQSQQPPIQVPPQ